MIDYLIQGTPPSSIDVGITCLAVGLVIVYLGARLQKTLIAAVGVIFALSAMTGATVWHYSGPFSFAWIIVPSIFFSLSILFSGFGSHIKYRDKFSAICLLLGLAGALAYQVKLSSPGPGCPPGSNCLSENTFCPGNLERSRHGNLLTEKFIPLRAVARLPNIRLSRSTDVDDLSQFSGIMRPWFPYFVFEQNNRAIQISETVRTSKADRSWVSEDASFCWTTRECLNIEQPMHVYGNETDADSNTNPLERNYTYAFAESFVGKDVQEPELFRMPCMPILSREDDIWAFVRPVGKASEGYQVAWLQWDESPSAEIRLRITRRELDEYIVGLQRLLIEYRNPELKEGAKRKMYGAAGDFISSSERDDKSTFQLVTTRLEGIPKLDGFVARPPENELGVEKIKDDLKRLIIYQSTADNWDVNDVAYPLLSDLP